MLETTLAIAGASTLAVALVYGYVGLRLTRAARAARGNERAMQLFGMWWLATSINQIGGSTLYLAASVGWTDVMLQLTYVYVQRLLLAISLIGLMYYLLYLQTGKGRLPLLILVYSAYFASQVYVLAGRAPLSIQSYGWRTDIVWDRPEPAVFQLFNLAIVGPPIIGALAMLRIYPRVGTTTRRFRIAMLGIGFVTWWIVAIASGQPQAFGVAWLQALNRVVGLAVAIGVLLAYEPMPWMRRRFQLEPFAQGG